MIIKIDLNSELKTLEGRAFTIPYEDETDITKDGQPKMKLKKMKLRDILIAASYVPKDNMAPIQILERDDLARKIYSSNGSLEITVEQAAQLKENVPRLLQQGYHLGCIAQALRMIESESCEDKKDAKTH